jgi:hypothetical protein
MFDNIILIRSVKAYMLGAIQIIHDIRGFDKCHMNYFYFKRKFHDDRNI